MEKDNKILLGAVLILLVAMVSFNFSSLTGKATSTSETEATLSAVSSDGDSSVYFSQDDVRGGQIGQGGKQPVTVTVTVKSGRIDNSLELYRKVGSSEAKKEEQQVCTGSSCGKGTYTVVYQLNPDHAGSSSEPKEYLFKVYDDRNRREVFKSNVVTVSKWVRPVYNYQG